MIKVPARGPTNARILALGEAPGKVEEATGKPFMGPAGNVLTQLLMKAGIDPDEDVFYTNICKYRPPDNELATWFRHGVPNEQVEEGMRELKAEIAAVNPHVILALGNWPLYVTYGTKLNKEGEPTGISSYRGYVLEGRKVAAGRKVIPSYHPSYYLRGKMGDSALGKFDLERVREQSAFRDIRRRPRKWILDPRGAERDAIRTRLLTEGRRIVVDIEYIKNVLKCVGFAVSDEWAVSIMIRSVEDVHFVRSIIESGRPLCMQNAMYDCGILEWHYQIDAWKNLKYDTMVAEYNLNIEFPKDLGALGSYYTDMPAWWDVISWEKIKKGQQSIEELLPYNCGDGVVTYEVAEKQLPLLQTDPKIWEAFNFDMSKLYPLWDMARRGVRIDLDRVSSLKNRAEEDELGGQVWLNKLCDALDINLGKSDFNVKGPSQVATLLFDHLGIPTTPRTPSGEQYKTDNISLMERLRTAENETQKRALTKIVQVRKARDLQSKFTELEWDDDGRARCIYDCTKTGTRRLSSKKFFPTGRGTNLQNQFAPSSSDYGEEVRECYVPDPGYEFAYADLKGAEFLVVAELTQDPLMLKYAEMTVTGVGSVHKETAGYIFGVRPEEVDKEGPFYFLGKKLRHSGNYMIGPKELMGRINEQALRTGVWVNMGKCKMMIDGYKQLHPLLVTWWYEVEAEARENRGRLRNLFGYVRLFHDLKQLPVMVAFKPQSTVGDTLNKGLLRCYHDEELRWLGYQQLLQVHDAIGYQYPISNRESVNRRVRELMDIPLYIPKTGGTLHIPVEILVGPNWGQLKEWHDVAQAA